MAKTQLRTYQQAALDTVMSGECSLNRVCEPQRPKRDVVFQAGRRAGKTLTLEDRDALIQSITWCRQVCRPGAGNNRCNATLPCYIRDEEHLQRGCP